MAAIINEEWKLGNGGGPVADGISRWTAIGYLLSVIRSLLESPHAYAVQPSRPGATTPRRARPFDYAQGRPLARRAGSVDGRSARLSLRQHRAGRADCLRPAARGHALLPRPSRRRAARTSGALRAPSCGRAPRLFAACPRRLPRRISRPPRTRPALDHRHFRSRLRPPADVGHFPRAPLPAQHLPRALGRARPATVAPLDRD